MIQEQKPALVFDAFGTLFDVSVLGDLVNEHISTTESFASVWRGTQLQYAFIRTMTNAYEDFDQVTRDALDRALELNEIEASESTRQRLVELWSQLPLYDESRQMLEAFRGYPRTILSNGTFDTVTSLIKAAGIEQEIDMVLSADSVARFKPDSMVYAMAPAALEVPRNAIHFVSSNAFDVAGAKAAGFNVYWVNRTRLPFDSVGREPDVTISNLMELTHHIA